MVIGLTHFCPDLVYTGKVRPEGLPGCGPGAKAMGFQSDQGW